MNVCTYIHIHIDTCVYNTPRNGPSGKGGRQEPARRHRDQGQADQHFCGGILHHHGPCHAFSWHVSSWESRQSLTAPCMRQRGDDACCALDEPWYILNLIVRTVGHHLNHSIAIAFDIAAFAHTALGEEPKDGQRAKVDCLGPSRRRFHGTHLSRMHHQARGHVPLALPVCCAVVLHLRCSWRQHESTRHLAGEHRHHGFRQRGLLPPRGHELSAQRHGHVLRCGGEHLRRGMLSLVCSTQAAIPQDTAWFDFIMG